MTNNTEIRPFRIDIPQADLDDLRDRLTRTRWASELDIDYTGAVQTGPLPPEWEYGVPLAYVRRLVGQWLTTYDWRKWEERLNSYPQFVTEIDGQNVHFFHVRSADPNAIPLVLTHGWPNTSLEYFDLIEPLTNPRNGEQAFHVVIPSVPGFGFSGPTKDRGWNRYRVAGAWAELMRRLGYERYGVHGTDVGAGVSGLLGMVDAGRVAGVHLTGTSAAMPFGPPVDPAGLSGLDRDRALRFNAFQADGLGYLHLQATRPQTLAYALTDSPVGQLAWMVEKFREWTDPAAELPEQAVDLDQLLAGVSVSWFTRAGASSAHGTYEGMQAYRAMVERQASGGGAPPEGPPGPPTGVAVFAADTGIRSLLDPAGTMEHWTEYDSGGHFPAMEVPELLTGDVRAFFRRHR